MKKMGELRNHFAQEQEKTLLPFFLSLFSFFSMLPACIVRFLAGTANSNAPSWKITIWLGATIDGSVQFLS